MTFSKTAVDYATLKPLTIDGSNIDFVSRIKYLGTIIVSSPALSLSNEEDLRSFYRASNSILNGLHSPDESILMYLLYTHCVPCFSFAAAVKDFSANQTQECTTALNDAIRKIFTFNRWESVRALREGFGYPSLCDIFAKARNKFLNSLSNHENRTISQLQMITSGST